MFHDIEVGFLDDLLPVAVGSFHYQIIVKIGSGGMSQTMVASSSIHSLRPHQPNCYDSTYSTYETNKGKKTTGPNAIQQGLHSCHTAGGKCAAANIPREKTSVWYCRGI